MRNLRVFMKELEDNGDLAVVKDQTDWALEAAAVTAKSYQKAGPALHFRSIEGYPDGFTLAGGLFTGPGNLYLEKRKYWHRVCTAMQLPLTTTYAQFLGACLERMTHPILPVEVDTGPAKDVIKKDGDVELGELPIPISAEMPAFFASPSMSRSFSVASKSSQTSTELSLDSITDFSMVEPYL